MKRIITNSQILGGKPIVEGTRLSVELILGLMARGMTQQEIVEQYPLLNLDDVAAVLDYAARSLENDRFVDVPELSRT